MKLKFKMKFAHTTAYSFGHSKKGELDKTDPLYTPGPGQYAPIINVKTMPKWKIGTSTRISLIKTGGPGPGQYSIPYCFPRGPKYTISSKSGFIDKSKSFTSVFFSSSFY